jgi:hypothetical protein
MSRKALAAAVSLLAFLSAPALAADRGQEGSWTVAPIDLPSGGAKFCSMKNSFAGGHTLVFARSTAGADSLAVDFGAKSLQAGHPYDVTLAAGSASRDISAIAATQKVLLVNLSGDTEFLDAVAGADSLKLAALNAGYSYDLSGSGDALQALQECVEALGGGKRPAPHVAAAAKKAAAKPQPKIEPVTVALAPVSPSAPAAPDPELARLRAENAALRAKAESARNAAEEAQQNKEESASALAVENAKLQKALSIAKEDIARKEAAARAARAEEAKPAPAPEAKTAAVPEAAKAPRSVESILAAAFIVPPGAKPSPAKDGVAYNWQTGGLFASAETTKTQGRSFGGLVADYFARMARLCKGDFAHTAGVPQEAGGLTVEKAEMACIDDTSNPAAALLFVGDGQRFAVVTREGSKELMETALVARDAAADTVIDRATN